MQVQKLIYKNQGSKKGVLADNIREFNKASYFNSSKQTLQIKVNKTQKLVTEKQKNETAVGSSNRSNIVQKKIAINSLLSTYNEYPPQNISLLNHSNLKNKTAVSAN